MAARFLAGLIALAGAFAGAAPAAPATPATGVVPAAEARPPRTLHVGPAHALKRIRDAARVARDGDTVEIAPGDYVDDVASWPQSRLTLRASACCARLIARHASAEGKATWVIKGDEVLVENVEFHGARNASRNGAGIRHEGRRLVVRNARFTGNEIGLLTWNDAAAELEVESSEFDGNAVDPRHGLAYPGHQVYIGRIARFTLRDSYVHGGRDGHLVKSRAAHNLILYNRLDDSPSGRASYELEFPEGGDARVVGNVLHQSPATANRVMIAFGAEGSRGADDRLLLAFNTLVDGWPGGGTLLRVWNKRAEVVTLHNLLVTFAVLGADDEAFGAQDVRAHPADLPRARDGDYRPRADAPFSGALRGLAVPEAALPRREYVHPRTSRALDALPATAGAMQSVLP